MLTSRNLIALVALGAGLSLTSCAEDSADGAGDDAGAADDDAADDDAADDDAADDDAADDDAADDDAADDDAADDDVADDDVVETDAGGDDDVVETDAGGDDDVETDAGGDDDVETDSGTPAGPAVAKFCNSLSFNDAATTLTLAVGEGDAQVTFTAITGECVPADGLACLEVPSGAAVLVELYDAADTSAPLDSGTTTLDAGGEYAFYTEILEEAPVWSGVILDGDLSCSEFNYDSF